MQDSIDRRRAGRHDHDQHGRSATSPLDIRWRGWTQILKRTWTEIQEDRVLLVAAGAAFYVFLSIVPALSALLSIYGLVFDPQSAREQAQVFLQWLPAEAQSLIGEQMARLTGEAPTRLGTALAVSLAISIWSASAATKAVIEGLNVVYDEQEKRSSIALYAVALAFTAGGLVLVVALVAVNIVLSSFIDQWLGQAWAPRILGAALVAFAAWIGLIAFYRWGPSRDEPQWRWLLIGSIAAILLLAAASVLFSWYTRTFAAYSGYGSVGAVIGLLTWIWLSMAIVLAGAELNAETEHQTAMDTTVGAAEPMGGRGAHMADSVGGEAGGRPSEEGATVGTGRPAPGLGRAPTRAAAWPPSPAEVGLVAAAALLGLAVQRLLSR